MLDAITAAPVFVRNGRMDLLAANRLGRAFYSQHLDSPHGPDAVAVCGRDDGAASCVRRTTTAPLDGSTCAVVPVPPTQP